MISEDDRHEAWWAVVAQIDSVLDGEAMPATDRGVLVELRRQAMCRLSPEELFVPDFVPASWVAEQVTRPTTSLERWDAAKKPGGVIDAFGYADNWPRRVVTAGYVTVDQLAAASDDDLLAVRGVGHARLGSIRVSVDRYLARSRS